jgi:hypothetical protein
MAVDTVTDTGWRCLALEQMSQVLATVVAKQLDPCPAIRLQQVLPDAFADVLPERRESATCIKLCGCFEQGGSAIGTHVPLFALETCW